MNLQFFADTDGKLADAFGGRVAGSNKARRVSFLTGLAGKIARVAVATQADAHRSEMKAAIETLKKQ